MKFKLSILLFVFVIFTSCSKKIVNVLPENTMVPGLVNDFKNEDIVNLIFVHGTGEKTAENFDDFAFKLADKLNFTFDKSKNIKIPNNDWLANLQIDTEKDFLNQAVLRLMQFSEATKRFGVQNPDIQAKTLRVYSIVWSDLTLKSKEYISDLDQESNSKQRVFFNNMLKEDFNDKFVDLVLYAGEYKPMIQLISSLAISRTFAKDPFVEDKDLELDFSIKQKNILVGGSFGSKIIWDMLSSKGEWTQNYLNPKTKDLKVNPEQEIANPVAFLSSKHDPFIFSKPNNSIARNFIKNLDRIYFMSNQLPLYGLADVNPSTKFNEQNIEDVLYRNWWSESKKDNKIKLIAFNDPNDFLGFQLPNKKNNPNIINIQHNNHLFPFLLANPKKSHEGWKRNKKVIDFMVEGYNPESRDALHASQSQNKLQ